MFFKKEKGIEIGNEIISESFTFKLDDKSKLIYISLGTRNNSMEVN